MEFSLKNTQKLPLVQNTAASFVSGSVYVVILFHSTFLQVQLKEKGLRLFKFKMFQAQGLAHALQADT